MASNSQCEKKSNELLDGEVVKFPNEGINPPFHQHNDDGDSKGNDVGCIGENAFSDVNLERESSISKEAGSIEEDSTSIGMNPDQQNLIDNASDSKCHQIAPHGYDCPPQDTRSKNDKMENVRNEGHDPNHTESNENNELSIENVQCVKIANQDQDASVIHKNEEDESKQSGMELDDPHQHKSLNEPCEPPVSQSTDDRTQDHIRDTPESSKLDPSESFYYLKRFRWKGEQVQIITQNENGPCPLLAIANVLILSKRILIPSMQECITAHQIMEYVGDYILSSGPQNVDETVILNYQQNMQDAISIMYKLQTGIDVNVKFTSPRHFELTQECLVFDILNIGLYHGWLIDPQDSQISNAVGSLSYNQLVDKIIKSKDETSSEKVVREGLLAESFLEQTASQLTYHGLCELNSEIKEEELCIFFRNNHFNTLYKYKGKLYLLVTDQGYLNQSKIIWETLADVDGESQFVNENFGIVGPLTAPQTYPNCQPQTQNELSQEDRDYLIALSLQEETSAAGTNEPTPLQVNVQSNDPSKHQEQQDLELARHLQEQEDRMAREGQARQHQMLQQQQLQHQQQLQNQHSHNQQLSRQQHPGGVHAENRNVGLLSKVIKP